MNLPQVATSFDAYAASATISGKSQIIKGVAILGGFVSDTYIISARCVFSAYRIVPAIGEHVESKQALTRACVIVGIDESSDLGIVISGLEVIQSGLNDIDIAARVNY